AQALLEFVERHPGAIVPKGQPALRLWGQEALRWEVVAGVAGQADPVAVLAALTANWRPMALFSAAWGDDPYSRDLAERFSRLFQSRFVPVLPDGPIDLDVRKTLNYGLSIGFSVGDFYQPSQEESSAVGHCLDSANPDYNRLLLLPTN